MALLKKLLIIIIFTKHTIKNLLHVYARYIPFKILKFLFKIFILYLKYNINIQF